MKASLRWIAYKFVYFSSAIFLGESLYRWWVREPIVDRELIFTVIVAASILAIGSWLFHMRRP